MVEFALLAPLLFVMLLGLIDFARAVFYYNVISNAAREGTREAIVAYNRCQNLGPTCTTPLPSGSSLVGIYPAVQRVSGGIMSFTPLYTSTDTGTAPACTYTDSSGTHPGPGPNQGCVWIYQVGHGGLCQSSAGKKGGPDSIFAGGTDQYSLCDFNQSKLNGPTSQAHYDVVVEIQYRFAAFTPLIGQLVTKNGVMWAKSDMRPEY